VIPTRTAIEELVAAYALALESRDINAVRRVYPGMTQQQERDLSAALPSMQAANLRVESLQEQGDEATARVAGEYVFLDGGRQQRAPVQFTATFQRDGTAWRMTRTQ
jgi:ketosteroid isomerase-like protein